MSRILIVANRLPVTFKSQGDEISVELSAGGVATGLRGPHERSGGKWIGWPGSVSKLSSGQKELLGAKLDELKTVPLYLTDKEVHRYYEGFANGALWPLFHYLLDKVHFDARDWRTYHKVNERFADLVAEHYQDGDMIWVQDYQLMLLPGMLRARLPGAHIGFFLHIPFPSSEVFRLLPWREDILEGLLGADLIGFHTLSYARHFSTTLLRQLGIESHVDRIEHDGREIHVGAYPMGIDARDFSERAEADDAQAVARQIRDKNRDCQVLLGIDRLDYTKGVPDKLMILEHLLAQNPALRGKIKLVQVAVPSRTGIPAYEAFRRSVDEMVGRINGRFGTPDWVPIHYLYRSLKPHEIVAMYKAADVMLVTPLRDGMNLVAKEFVACRNDETGALVLSELAGSAAELGEAVRVNPYDVDGTARRILETLSMDPDEQKQRMRAMRHTVMTYDVHHWAESFLGDLGSVSENAPQSSGGVPARGRSG